MNKTRAVAFKRPPLTGICNELENLIAALFSLILNGAFAYSIQIVQYSITGDPNWSGSTQLVRTTSSLPIRILLILGRWCSPYSPCSLITNEIIALLGVSWTGGGGCYRRRGC